VHEHYKKKHFPASAFTKSKPAPTTSSNASAALSDHAKATAVQEPAPPAIPATLKQLVNDFSQLQIEPEPPETEFSPQKPCPLAEIPEEILSHILLELAVADVASFARMAQVCKRMAYLVLTEESIWKRVTLGNECGFAAMHYNYATNIEGRPLEEVEDAEPRYLGSYEDHEELDENAAPLDPATRSLTHTLSLISKPYPSWRQMFRSRPRLRFNGCYISTVNYNRPGAHSSNSLAWGAPVLTVTYFRYLRFFRDGTVISLLTTAEPVDVVHHLTKEKLDPKTRPTGLLPGAVMKDALKGRWRLSGPASNPAPIRAEDFELRGNEQGSTSSSLSSDDLSSNRSPIEAEGTVHIDTKGVVPRYTYRLELGLGHAGKSARNNKLSWKGFWSYNRLSDDWGEFALRNDKPFYWSRVRSYGEGWD
jgi:F-box protein 9